MQKLQWFFHHVWKKMLWSFLQVEKNELLFLTSLQQNFVKSFINCIISLIFNSFLTNFLKTLPLHFLTHFSMTLSLCCYLSEIKLLDAKKNKLQNTRPQPNYLQFKELCLNWILQVLDGAQRWSSFHHRWLSWWFADWSSWLREPLILFDGNWVFHRSLFPRKEEIVDWWAAYLESEVSG